MNSKSSHYILINFFFNDTATTEIYTLSLHDALPISITLSCVESSPPSSSTGSASWASSLHPDAVRYSHKAEEHTSELLSRQHVVLRLFVGKKIKALNFLFSH